MIDGIPYNQPAPHCSAGVCRDQYHDGAQHGLLLLAVRHSVVGGWISLGSIMFSCRASTPATKGRSKQAPEWLRKGADRSREHHILHLVPHPT